MAVKEADLTGIDNVNEYYTNHYLHTMFANSIQTDITAWKNAVKENADTQAPWSRLQACARSYYAAHAQFQKQVVNEDTLDAIVDMAAKYLDALGYPAMKPVRITLEDDQEIPVALELTKEDGSPLLWVLLAAPTRNQEFTTGIMESHVFAPEDVSLADLQTGGGANEDLTNAIFFGQQEPPRWLLYIGMEEIALIDRQKWDRKQYLSFDLETIFSRNDSSTWQAMAILLHHDSICPDHGENVLDRLGEESEQNAEGVSEDLKYALRESIELLGNEVLYDVAHHPEHFADIAKQKGIKTLTTADVDASDLTLQCLRYMYRMLFVLFIESRTDLGYAPMKNEVYATGYSIENLRKVAGHISSEPTESMQEGTYLGDSLQRLFDLIYTGYPEMEEEQEKYSKAESQHDMFVLPPLKAHIFDPERTALLHAAKLRNKTMLRIIELMSITRATGKKNERRGRISYANLGINQMGAVYEALLSYRGFIAQEKLYEVKKADDKKYDELQVGYFVPESQLDQYKESERVRYTSGEKKGKPRCYEKGTFIYRLAGREREKSASYYTPEVLTKCLVKYALKELLKDKTADDILKITVCEPAMGSAAFLNETINQLADAYLMKRQEELGESIPYDQRPKELQKVKMFLADRNVYGVDLNPTAVELAEVSLWLNTIYEGGFVPWFGTQLVNGNSLIGARRECYDIMNLQATSKGLHWYEMPPTRIAPDKARKVRGKKDTKIYHFLTGDPGMANYTDKVIKGLEPENIKKIKAWQKEFTKKPYTDDEIRVMLALSAKIDELWHQQVELRETIDRETRDKLSIYGYEDDIPENHMTIRRKDEIYRKYYKSEHMKNAGPYARLRFAMDYWCALWFWPIEQADLLPSRTEFLSEMDFILEGTAVSSTGEDMLGGEINLFSHDEQLNLFASEREELQDAMAEKIHNCFPSNSSVDIDQLCQIFPRLALVRKIAKQDRFMHWELEFADVFARKGGMSLVVGNPPWIKLEWKEQNTLSDENPLLIIKSLNAKKVQDFREIVLSVPGAKKAYFKEYQSISGEQNFLNSICAYPTLKKQKTNLYKCFIVLSLTVISSQRNGTVSLICPEGVYDDPNGGALRKLMYERLFYRFSFVNEKKLFKEIHHERTFSLNVFGNKHEIKFDVINHLYAPSTIDDCYNSSEKENEAVPSNKSKDNQWILDGHPHRIIKITRNELKLFSDLFDRGTTWQEAKLPIIHCTELLDVLRILNGQKHNLFDYKDDVYITQFWNETNAKKDGTIYAKVDFPESISAMIYSGSHIGVANPIFKCTQREYKNNTNFDNIDLTNICEDYFQRTNYQPRCDRNTYIRRIPKTPWGSKITEEYRFAAREMLSPSGERTLISCILPPNTAHIHAILGISLKKELDVVKFSGYCSSLSYDFFVKLTGKQNLGTENISLLPIIDSRFDGEIIARTLLLNCLTKNYSKLWKDSYKDEFRYFRWAKADNRLSNEVYEKLTPKWLWDTPIRSDFSRRQALVEIDVLSSMALGMSLDELKTIYRIQFSVLNNNERNTWYDANGKIVFSVARSYTGSDKKGRKLVGVNPDEWKLICDYPAGKTYDHSFTDDTQPGGPVERTVTYVAPFDRCDREKDYETVWAFFEKKYGKNV